MTGVSGDERTNIQGACGGGHFKKRLSDSAKAGWPQPDMTKVKKLLGPAMPMMYGNIVEEFGMMNDRQLVYTTLQEFIEKEIERVMSK